MAESDWKNVQRNKTTGQYRTTDGGGGGGNVNDVEVDGVSVVNQEGVAEIPAVPEDFADLSDVQFSNLADHQLLRYNATSQKWVNGADSFPPLIYSDEEREIGVWRDGKPLYCKTIIGTYSFDSDADGALYIGYVNSSDIASNIDIGWFSRDMSYYVVSNTYFRGFVCGWYEKDTSKFVLMTKFSRSSVYCVLTFYYTKTTDTPGSGTWTNEGTYTHHYSTSEKVVGTWIDGKPVYEKSIEVSSLVSGDNTIQHGISNFGKLISVTGYVATTNDSDYNPIPCISQVSGWSIRARDFNSSTFVMEMGSAIVTYYNKGTVIIRYTKTTD